MKFKLAIITFLICLASVANAQFAIFQTAFPSNPNLRQENFFGLTGSAWNNFTGNYAPGLGNPAVSTADYYHQDGVAWMRPYYLRDAACGSAGSTIADARGDYVWLSSVDHPGNYSWQDGQGFRLGFSNDPGVPPATMDVFYVYNTVAASVQIASITASISGNNLIISAVTGGVSYNNNATVSGAGVTTETLTSFVSGTAGGVGTYTISGSPQTVASQSMTISQANYKLYQNPFFVCNPDDVTNPFYVYAEGQASSVQHEMGLIKSADLVTWSSPVPSHVTYTFSSTGSWSSFQRPVRDGANSWHSTGFQSFYPGANYFGSGKWTSTDGLVWVLGGPSTMFNVCLPPNSTGPTGATPCPDAPAVSATFGASLDTITIAAQAWSPARLDSFPTVGNRSGSQWIGRVPINSTFNVLNSPTRVHTSSAYGGVYPGPTYLQDVNSYVEDGVLHYYGEIGFPTSDALFGTVSAATYANGGGLWQQGLDYYTEIIDATAAAGAAPVGVRASCAASISSLIWYDVLLTQTYRLYRGTTVGSQPTLVGDFAGTSATDTGMTLNAVTYYKLVYMNGGVEQKSRIVSTYCSTSSAFINAHITRALAAGADAATCNRTWMDTFDAWLVSEGLSSNLLFGTMAEFCVAQNGSSVISKVFDLGTTRLPRSGDYTPITTSTTYSATGINGNPAWVNGTNVAWGYYGGGRFNNIRRKTQITVFSAYQNPNTNQATLLGLGENSGMVLYHSSGAPGTINFGLTDATQTLTATKSVSGLATDFHTIAGTFDGTTLLAYSDAVAGTGVTGLVIPSPNLNPPDALTGSVGLATNVRFLGAGSQLSKYTYGGTGYVFSNNQAQISGAANFVFDKSLADAQISSLNTLIRTHYGL